MEKNRLLLVPFFIGLFLLVYSWYTSFPLSTDPANDYVFNHISPLYWLSLPLLSTTMYLMALSTKNNIVRLLLTVGIVFTFFSISYFFNKLPGSDSSYFRGLTEYYFKTNSLDSSQLNHVYFQWPAFFIINKTAILLGGFTLFQYEFLQYALICILLSATLYIYASRFWKDRGPTAVIAFFLVSYSFLNYQDVPFSLALGLLFIIFMLENKQKTLAISATILILFTGICFTHAFVPLFYVLYLFFMLAIKKGKQYGALLLFTVAIFILIQSTIAGYSFASNIRMAFNFSSEYSSMVSQTLKPVSLPIDVVAQMFTRTSTIALLVTCLLGSALLFFKRKIRNTDKAIFLTGIAYSIGGVVLYTLGSRTIPLILIPISLGACCFFEHKTRPYLKYAFLMFLIFATFIPIHATLSNTPIMFQSQKEYQAANFILEKYNWSNTNTILSSAGIRWYLDPNNEGNATLLDFYSSPTQSLDINSINCIIYSTKLQEDFRQFNVTEETRQSVISNCNVVYSSGPFNSTSINVIDKTS